MCVRVTRATADEMMICMHTAHIDDAVCVLQLQHKAPAGATATVQLLGLFDPDGDVIINDPYYGGNDGFEYNFQQVSRCCNAILDQYA